jgi:outer membrane receptor protein involved in Fe transport
MFRGTTLHWSADYFFGQNYNDLLFVASEQTGFGYFLNFGRTRRDGVELELSHDWRQWSLGSNYTFLNATYQSAQTIDGGSNSTNNTLWRVCPALMRPVPPLFKTYSGVGHSGRRFVLCARE